MNSGWRSRVGSLAAVAVTLLLLGIGIRAGIGYYAEPPSGSASEAVETLRSPTPSQSTPTDASTTATSADPTATPTGATSSGSELYAGHPFRALVLPERPRVLVVGGAWAAGAGLPRGAGWVPQATALLKWSAVVAPGGAGSGFTVEGTDGTFADRIREAKRRPIPDLVILDAGQADIADDSSQAQWESALRVTLTAIGERFPSAQVLVVGPVPTDPGDAERAHQLDLTLAGIASPAGVPYISPLVEGWFATTSGTDSPEAGLVKGVRLTATGAMYVARRFVLSEQALEP